MIKKKTTPSQALIDQLRLVQGWLTDLPHADFTRPTVLADWDVRMLTGHLILIADGLDRMLESPTRERPVPVHEYVQRYRRDATMINESTETVTGDRTGPDLVQQLGSAIDALADRLLVDTPLPKVVQAPRGPSSLVDVIATRIVDVVVHADDLTRSLPELPPIELTRPALSSCCRTLTTILAGQHPGQSIEVRVPPFAAVQCGIGEVGPTHTRGTPPNVVETDPRTFLRLATGRTTWAGARAAGAISASGLRADLSAVLPVLS